MLAVRDLDLVGVVGRVGSLITRLGRVLLARLLARRGRRRRGSRTRAHAVLGGSRKVLATPLLDDGGENGPAGAGRLDVDVGSLVGGGLEVLVERAGVGAVEEDGRVGVGGGGPGADVVAGLLADEVEDVGADVEAAEGVKVPVGLDGGDLGVVVVVAVVLGAVEMLGDGVTEQDAEDAVALGVCLALVEGEQDKGTVPEAGLLVVDERLEQVAAPLASGSDGGVVACE